VFRSGRAGRGAPRGLRACDVVGVAGSCDAGVFCTCLGGAVATGETFGGFDRSPFMTCLADLDVAGRRGSSLGGAVLRKKSARSWVWVFGLVSDGKDFHMLVD
jgi:hypothetical protein